MAVPPRVNASPARTVWPGLMGQYVEESVTVGTKDLPLITRTGGAVIDAIALHEVSVAGTLDKSVGATTCRCRLGKVLVTLLMTMTDALPTIVAGKLMVVFATINMPPGLRYRSPI